MVLVLKHVGIIWELCISLCEQNANTGLQDVHIEIAVSQPFKYVGFECSAIVKVCLKFYNIFSLLFVSLK